MMKKRNLCKIKRSVCGLICTSIFLSSWNVFAIEQNKKLMDSENLIYKEIEMQLCNYDEDGNISFSENHEKYYDQYGRLIMEVILDEDNEMLWLYSDFKHDKEGNCIEKKFENWLGDKGSIYSKYDDNYNCILEEKNNEDSTSDTKKQYIYDEESNLLCEDYYIEDYSIDKYEYIFKQEGEDNEGKYQIWERIFCTENIKEYSGIVKCYYDENKYCIKKEYYDVNDKLYCLKEFKYACFDMTKLKKMEELGLFRD